MARSRRATRHPPASSTRPPDASGRLFDGRLFLEGEGPPTSPRYWPGTAPDLIEDRTEDAFKGYAGAVLLTAAMTAGRCAGGSPPNFPASMVSRERP